MCALSLKGLTDGYMNAVEKAENLDASVSRRALFSAGALASALMVSESASAQEADIQSGGGNPWRSVENRLVRRITMGITQEDAATAKRLGFSAYLEQQLNHTRIDDSVCERYVASRYPAVNASIAQLDNMDSWRVWQQLGAATVYRSVFSKRQLYQRMVEFWTDHFNIDIDKVGPALKVVDDREVIRKYALDTFPKLLRASAKSTAMLYFLDNTNSYVGHPNINYARELEELHTMGVNGGYTPRDIREVARCFTGWMMEWDKNSPNYGNFVFNEWAHDFDEKTVLGHRIPAGRGIQDGEQVLEILLNHPSTAKFIARKMARWLLMYEPSESLVNSVAGVFTRSRGDIKAMIRAILTRTNVSRQPAKLKRPYHFAVSALRSLKPTVRSLEQLHDWRLYVLGQRPFNWSPPDGYPDNVEFWVGALLPRWNFAGSLMNDEVDGVQVNVRTLFSGLRTATQVVEKINQMLFGGEMPTNEKATLTTYLGARATDPVRQRAAIAMALSGPGFQCY
ncbi:MAG TPA: DUF1800 domain-containing protein [Fimbriimonadaceae bacterium]|nr:DUF1800 domain-containing protein [Fimbriimonadaceae bacterium]